jgi:hypothetical protein
MAGRRSAKKSVTKLGLNKSNSKPTSEQLKKLRLYACAVPVFGLIPSVIALASGNQNQNLRTTAKFSLGLLLVWLLSYASLGAGQEISQDLYRGTATTVYFLACFGTMVRLYLSKPKSKPQSEYDNQSPD